MAGEQVQNSQPPPLSSTVDRVSICRHNADIWLRVGVVCGYLGVFAGFWHGSDDFGLICRD